MLRRLLICFFIASSFIAFPIFSFAAATTTANDNGTTPADIGTGFNNILTNGIIFANICATPSAPGAIDTCACRAVGRCSLAQILQFAVNITIFILGISGSVALLMFFYGGLLWINSQGRPDFVDAGKDTLKHAVIGLAIIFSAYAFVNYILAALIGNTPSDTIENTIKSTTGTDASSVLKSDVTPNTSTTP